MVVFSFLDWFWLVVFIVFMIVCGVLFYKLGKRSLSDFFLAGRGLPWWLPAVSVYATHSATDTPMWISGVLLVIMLRIIDPKLKAISEDYEIKQKKYLEDLEKISRWEE